MDEAAKVHFSLVVKREAIFRFRQLADVRGQLKYWIRGDGQRFLCTITKFDPDILEWDALFLKSAEIPEKIYYSFQLSGQDYFGRAYSMRTNDPSIWKLRITDNLYKSEKRFSQRLLVYPHRKVDVDLPNPIIEAKAEGSLISFGRKKKGTQTTLMLKFLELVGDNNPHMIPTLKLRVLDISWKGAALYAGRDVKDFFSPGATFSQCKIDFEKQVFTPIDLEVIYRRHVKMDSFVGAEHFRIGVAFKNFHQHSQEKLKSLIEELINKGDSTADFEIFRS